MVELIRIKKLTQRYAQAVTDHFDRQQLGIAAFSVKNILDAGRRKRGKRGKPVDRDIMLSAKLQDSIFCGCVGIHFISSFCRMEGYHLQFLQNYCLLFFIVKRKS